MPEIVTTPDLHMDAAAEVSRRRLGLQTILRWRPSWARLVQLDVPEWALPFLPVPVSQLLFGLFCFAVAVILRLVTDLGLPGAGPFALMVPSVLVATLFGRWFSGVVCLVVSSVYAWYFVLPEHGSFSFVVASDGPRVVVNVASGFFVVALAELFRRTMRQALAEREMLLLELEHRVKNNFAAVSGMLRMQMRQTDDDFTKLALQSAMGRVESFARANSSLYRGRHYTGTVDMGSYLQELCHSLQTSLGTDTQIRIRCKAETVDMIRDRAIIVGLLVNEVATNSVKHAFIDGRPGVIDVVFEKQPGGYSLTVSDNGRGLPDEKRGGAIGLTLIDALATQAGGSVEIDNRNDGAVFRFAFTP